MNKKEPKRYYPSVTTQAMKQSIEDCLAATNDPVEVMLFTYLKFAFEKHAKEPDSFEHSRSVRELISKLVGYKLKTSSGKDFNSALDKWMREGVEETDAGQAGRAVEKTL